MESFVSFLRRALHVLLTPVRLVREGQSDLDATYPDHRRPNGQEQVAQGMVVTSLISNAGGGTF